MEKEYLELYDLLARIGAGIDELFPELLWVKAEIASLSVKSNGHCYLELSQNDGFSTIAKARAMIWKGKYSSVAKRFREATGGDLAAGISILCQAKVSFSELYGLSLVIEDIEPEFTLGEAELSRRRTIEALEKERLLDRQSLLELPALPLHLAVISSATAAGFGDFCRHLSENEYGFKFDIELIESAMQGDSCPPSICEALRAVETSPVPYDAVLILRGGGSVLDLACFDDYQLCRAIALCPVPVFTAIGHDRDSHVADMVAFRAVKTPTALADEFISALSAEDERVASFVRRLQLAFLGRISLMESKVDMLQSRIKAADPRNVISRGYSLVTDEKGVVVKKVSQISKGDKIFIYLSDGIIKARTDE